MNDQSTNNNANSLNDLFATGEGATTNQVSSSGTIGQSNSVIDQVSQNQGVFTTQTSTGINSQPVINQNSVDVNNMAQSVMPNQGVTMQTPTGINQQPVINQSSVNTNNMAQPVIPNQGVTPNTNVVNQNFSNTMDDEVFLKAFIGKNYDKITTRNFNFSAFFFSSFYVLYRKMFWQGLVLYCAMFAANNLFGSIGKVISLVIALATGLMFNKIYVKYATDEVEKIKQENPNGNSNAINLACFSKGGTSVGNIFLGLFIVMVISTIFGMIFPSTTISTM